MKAKQEKIILRGFSLVFGIIGTFSLAYSIKLNSLSLSEVNKDIIRNNTSDYISLSKEYNLEDLNDYASNYISEETLTKVNDTLDFNGVVSNYSETVDFSNVIKEKKETSSNLLSNYFPKNTTNYLPVLKDLSIYDEFDSLEGELPSEINEVLITDVQLDIFETLGYEFESENETYSLSKEEISKDPSLLICKPLSYSYLLDDNLIIKGIINTHFDYSKYDDIKNDILEGKNVIVPEELVQMFNYSYSNMLLVSNDYYDLLKDNLDISYSFKDNVSMLYHDDKGLYLSTEKALLPSGYYYDNLVYLEGTNLDDSSFGMSLDKYVNYLSSTNQIDDSIKIRLPKEFVFDANSDTLINEKPSEFLTNLDSYALNYLASKNYKAYFDENKFYINLYASKYFNGQSYDLNNLKEEEKVEIFKLYLKTVLSNYPKNSVEVALHKENKSYLTKLIDYLITIYDDELFTIRDFNIKFSDNSVTALTLVALDPLNNVDRFYFSEANSLKFLENSTNYYSALISLNAFDDEKLDTLVSTINEENLIVNNMNIKNEQTLNSMSANLFKGYLTTGIIALILFIGVEVFSRFKVERYLLIEEKETIKKASKDILVNEILTIGLSSVVLVISLLLTNSAYGVFLGFNAFDFLYIVVFSIALGLIQIFSKYLLEKLDKTKKEN